MYIGGRFVAEWHPEIIAIAAGFHAIFEKCSRFKDFKNTFLMVNHFNNIPLCKLQNTGAQRAIVYQDLVWIFVNNFVGYLLNDGSFAGGSEECQGQKKTRFLVSRLI